MGGAGCYWEHQFTLAQHVRRVIHVKELETERDSMLYTWISGKLYALDEDNIEFTGRRCLPLDRRDSTWDSQALENCLLHMFVSFWHCGLMQWTQSDTTCLRSPCLSVSANCQKALTCYRSKTEPVAAKSVREAMESCPGCLPMRTITKETRSRLTMSTTISAIKSRL